jgi:hypothetical protein
MPGPYLDPMNPQAPFAAAILELTRTLVLSDPQYVARLERHYQMVKDRIAASKKAKTSPRSRGRKSKKKRKRRPSGWGSGAE